jgi:hypothetical protein
MAEYAQRTWRTSPPTGSTRVARSQAQLRSAASIDGSAAAGQQPLQAALNQAPVVQAVAQLKRTLNQSGRVGQVAQLSSVLQETHRDVAQTVQRVEDEEMIQGKFATAQRLAEEEEPLQGKFETVQRVEEEEMLQGKFATAQRLAEEEEPLQGKFRTVQREAAAEAPNRTGMPDQLKAGIESLSGMDVSDVRVHRNSGSPAGLDALAYAQGDDIHLAPGQDHHLPHEAWHVVQQRQGRVAPTMQLQGVSINDDHGLEAEADRMGAKASQLKKDHTPPSS